MKAYLSLIKFSHTVFALPFALLSFFLAWNLRGTGPDWRLFVLILFCMVFARSAAMAFNRYADRYFDADNLRTRIREIPTGTISPQSALFFTLVMALAFGFTTYWINSLAFYLSPLALLIILGYSYSKRFTWLCHFILGIALGLAPVGAFIAVTGNFHLLPCLYGVMVMLWVSGFDIIYALQDEAFDQSHGLYSIPGKFGKESAKRIAFIIHMSCALLLIVITWYQAQLLPALGWIHWVGAVGFIFLLIWQHRLIARFDLQRINQAFFETNGIASIALGLAVIIDIWW